MAVTRILRSSGVSKLSAVSMLVEAGLELSRGSRALAGLLLGGAALAYRSTTLGFLVQGLVRVYKWRR